MSSGDIALLILEIIGDIASVVILAVLLGLWVTTTWGRGV